MTEDIHNPAEGQPAAPPAPEPQQAAPAESAHADPDRVPAEATAEQAPPPVETAAETPAVPEVTAEAEMPVEAAETEVPVEAAEAEVPAPEVEETVAQVEEPVAQAEELVAPVEDEPAEDEPLQEAAAHDEPSPSAEVDEAHVEPGTEVQESVEAVAVAEAEPEKKKNWYVVKVQSGREDTIKEAIERRMRKDGLEEFFGQIVIPVEKVSEVKTDKNGKKVTKTKERKLYAGYLFVEVEYNDRILYLFRETSGVGDFVGSHPGQPDRAPTPMTPREIQRILGVPTEPDAGGDKVPPPPKGLSVSSRVRVVDGPFNGMEAVVRGINEAAGRVQVELSIFGRPVNVDFEYYQVEQE